MRKVQSAVKENDTRNEFDWEKSLMLWKVRVPVVRLSTRVGIDVDIQFDNEHSIRNTNFVRHCVQVSLCWILQAFATPQKAEDLVIPYTSVKISKAYHAFLNF